MRKLITILIVTLAAISCGKIKDAHNTLNDIETFINERPDSALTILDSFDISLLDHKSVWAHHSLLHAQAKDKCYIDETNDSLMTQVVNYYEGKRDKEKLFKAYYYLGRIQYNAGDYVASMLSYTKAEQMIYESKDDMLKGLLYTQMGVLYSKYYDYKRSLTSHINAYNQYELCYNIRYQYLAKLHIGNLYIRMNQYENAVNELNDIIDWSRSCQEATIESLAIEQLIQVYVETSNFDDLNNIIPNVPVNIQHRLTYPLSCALSAAFANNVILAEKYIDASWKNAKSAMDSINIYHYQYKVYKMLDNHPQALLLHEKLYQIQDTLTRNLFYEPLISAQSNYYKASLDNNKLKMTNQRQNFIIVILVITSVLILSVTSLKHKISIRNIEINKYVELADGLENIVLTKKEEIDMLSGNIANLDDKLKESARNVSELFSKQYELLNRLTSTYYETHGCKKDKEAIYSHVKKEIEKLSSNKDSLIQLENVVNCNKNNIMKTIRQYLPNLTEIEYRHLCYWCAGFSAKAISIFTGDSTNNIYVKKSRIKTVIMTLPTDVRNEILSAI